MPEAVEVFTSTSMIERLTRNTQDETWVSIHLFFVFRGTDSVGQQSNETRLSRFSQPFYTPDKAVIEGESRHPFQTL